MNIYSKYDAIEITTVAFLADASGDPYAEHITSQEWFEQVADKHGITAADLKHGMYGHLPTGGVEHIVDFDDPEACRQTAQLIAQACGFDKQGPLAGCGGVMDQIFIPGKEQGGITEENKVPRPPRSPEEVLKAIIVIAEGMRMPLRKDEGDPKGHGADANDYFGGFENYFDDSDAQHMETGGGAMIIGGNVRVCWPDLAALIDEAKASITDKELTGL
jgi:hypothetical protein